VGAHTAAGAWASLKVIPAAANFSKLGIDTLLLLL
jgi:hypothetical protein